MYYRSRTLNNKINFIHKRALRTTFNDRKSPFEEVLSKDNSQMFKIKNDLAREILNEIFQDRTSSCNSKKNSSFSIREVYEKSTFILRWYWITAISKAVVRRCSVKNLFLKISQNSQKNASLWVSFLIKRLWRSCFPVNVV